MDTSNKVTMKEISNLRAIQVQLFRTAQAEKYVQQIPYVKILRFFLVSLKIFLTIFCKHGVARVVFN